MFLSLLQTRCYHFGHWEWKRLQLAQRDCVLSRLTAQKFSGMPSTAASLTSSVTGLRAYATSVFVPPSCAAKSLSCQQKSSWGWCICAKKLRVQPPQRGTPQERTPRSTTSPTSVPTRSKRLREARGSQSHDQTPDELTNHTDTKLRGQPKPKQHVTKERSEVTNHTDTESPAGGVPAREACGKGTQ